MNCYRKWILGMQNKPAQNTPSVVFRRSPEYKETYLKRIKGSPQLRAKFRDFMEIKRHNPLQPFGSSDKSFVGGGIFSSEIPGLMHAHITFDLSIVYKVAGKNPTEVYLYGFYTHDELGTGQPSNRAKQHSMARSFKNRTFAEDQE